MGETGKICYTCMHSHFTVTMPLDVKLLMCRRSVLTLYGLTERDVTLSALYLLLNGHDGALVVGGNCCGHRRTLFSPILYSNFLPSLYICSSLISNACAAYSFWMPVGKKWCNYLVLQLTNVTCAAHRVHSHALLTSAWSYLASRTIAHLPVCSLLTSGRRGRAGHRLQVLPVL